MKIIKYGYRKDFYQVIQIVNLDKPESLFNSPKGLKKEIEKGTKFSYLEDREGNRVTENQVLEAIKKATA